jgi:hypothetical protein
MAIEGGCRCRTIRYSVARDTLPAAYACHCTDCQTWAGSAFTEQFFAPEAAFSIIAGEPAIYSFVNPMGRTSVQRMCPVCHIRIYNTNEARPGVVVVRAGTLDDSDRLDVPLHIWVKSKQPWLVLPVDAETYEESAPVEAMMRLALRTSG